MIRKFLSYTLICLLSTCLCFSQPIEGSVQRDSLFLHLYEELEQKQVDLPKMKFHCSGVHKIKISNQKQFDQLQSSLLSALKNGHRNIKVEIRKGTYFFKESHLSLNNLNYPDADIRIKGKKVIIVPFGWNLKDGDNVPCDVSGESCYLDLQRNEIIPTWGEMMYADSLVEILDVQKKRCRLKCQALGDLRVLEGNQAYIDLTRWCRCYQYKVEKIENGYVYFIAHDLQKDQVFKKDDYNVNYDYIYAKANPRFRLCNVELNTPVSVLDGIIHLQSGLESVYLGNATTFIKIQNCELHAFSVQGVTFLGSKVSSHPLILYKDSRAGVLEFTKCKFIGQRSRIVYFTGSNNLFFHNNEVKDNYEWGIVSEKSSYNTYVVNNIFENNGTGLSYARCVSCFGRNYYVGLNEFINFGYCAISVGTPYGWKMDNPSKGIVEKNHLYYDTEHFNNVWKYTIMDSGAIYVWTQNEECIVRYNYIHDYTGMRQNRGIYCDDGASNVKIYGNVVMNIPNWHAIDSRRVPGTEKANNPISHSERNNVNNVVMYNVTNGTINFVGRQSLDNGCLKGPNILLPNEFPNPKEKYSTTYDNLVIEEKDMSTSETYKINNGRLTGKSLKRLTKNSFPCYRAMSIKGD